MNSFKGTIKALEYTESFTLVKVMVAPFLLSAILITDDYIKAYEEGQAVDVLFNETEVVLAKGDVSGLSLRNRLVGNVTAIEKGKLLSRVRVLTAAGSVVSIITSESLLELDMKIDDAVIAMVKTNEVMLKK